MTNANIQHPLENGQQVVMVRSTASGFEQGIAALTGLCTAGPLGAIAAWGALRGLQGKWMPWALLGVPAAPILVGVQIAIGAAVLAPAAAPLFEETPDPVVPQSRTYEVPDAAIQRGVESVKEAIKPAAPVLPAVVTNPVVATNTGGAPSNTCWFEMASGANKGSQCDVSSRINANGHNVIDLVEPNGTKRAIVLWQNGDAEVFLNSKRYVGTHNTYGDRVSVTVGKGTFQFIAP